MSSAQAQAARADVVIFGGGIAGLWLLAQLRQSGVAAVLLEADKLAAGQTRAAQGIIHGGVKYDLEGTRAAAQSVSVMPARWRDALAGRGAVDLSGVSLLAAHCHFWVPRGLLGAMSGFLAAKVVRSRSDKLRERDWPEILNGAAQVGAVYRLDELVIEVASLVQKLTAANKDAVLKIDWPKGVKFERDEGGDIAAVELTRAHGAAVRLQAGAFVFLCGQGNEAVLETLRRPEIRAQRRPLHMLMMKGAPAPLYAHCFGLSDKPRLTITSHRAADGEWIWYIGGNLAETGVECNEAELIVRGRAEFAQLLPELDLHRARFAAFRVDRAEAAPAGDRRPDGPVLARTGNVVTAWPTKLALAPALADALVAELAEIGAARIAPALHALADWPKPERAIPPWDEAVQWQ